MRPVGHVDQFSEHAVAGWACDADALDQALTLELVRYGQVIATTRADRHRPDVQQAGVGTGSYGFRFAVPAGMIRPGGTRLVVREASTGLSQPTWHGWVFPGDRPTPQVLNRDTIAHQYLGGSGIEIGALHDKLRVAEHAHVTYVDRMPLEELLRHYPELPADRLVPVDVIDDGETLTRFEDGSLHFIIANHFLEHCENPLGTIRQHLAKLRPGGLLFYAVPDKRFTFDVARPITPLEHLVRDDVDGPEASRRGHYLEVARSNGHLGERAEAEAQELEAKGYSIHFHVWDAAAYQEFLVGARAYLGETFEVLVTCQSGNEVISVLHKVPG